MKQEVGLLGAVLLTLYQIPQLARIIRRRSASDFSIPAYCMVLGGLSCYAYATHGGPGFLSACVSLGNTTLLLAVVLRYRLAEVVGGQPGHQRGKRPLRKANPLARVQLAEPEGSRAGYEHDPED